MAIKGGQILHVSGGFVIDRIQTGGVSGINVNEDRLEELGNVEAVGTIRDIPDLTFEVESYDTTTELESILLGGINDEAAGTAFSLADFVPINVLSPFKTSGAFTTASSVVVPALSLESMSYSFALGDPATISATLRGDSVFYIPGSAYEETDDGTAAAGPFNFANTALKSTISGDDHYALSVHVNDGAGGPWVRQQLGVHYSNTASGITFLTGYYPPVGTDNIKFTYGSATVASYLQTVHDSTKPAGVRGRDIYVRLGDGTATPAYTEWLGVQSANVDWRVTLERDEEFGNSQVVAQDFDVPETSGSVTMKAADVSSLFGQIQAVAGVSSADIANATQDPPELQVEIKVADPADGTTLKTLMVTDAKFTLPSLQGSVGSKLEADFAFTGSSGALGIYKGDPA